MRGHGDEEECTDYVVLLWIGNGNTERYLFGETMTHHPIKTLSDGTRVYSNGVRYKRKKISERKYRIRKPDDPNAILWNGNWFLPLDLLPDEARTAPLTRPDTDAYDHAGKPRKCRCDVCRRPEAQRWRDKALRDQMRTPPSSSSESSSKSAPPSKR